jgi:hypothetical protein
VGTGFKVNGHCVRFEVFGGCRSCVNRRFGGTYRLHIQGRKIHERGTSVSRCRLQPPAHAGSSLADFCILKMEAIRSSETSVHTRYTWRHIPEDGILQWSLSFSRFYPCITCDTRGKLQKSQVVVACSLDEIQTGYLWNTSLDGDTNLVSSGGQKGMFSNRVISKVREGGGVEMNVKQQE